MVDTKPRKDKRMNSYFQSLEAEQSRRIKQCGDNAYNSYTSPNVIGTIFKEVIKRQMI